MSKSINSSAYSSASSVADLLSIFSNVDSSTWASKKGKQYTETELGDFYYEYLSTQEERAYNYWLTQDERDYNEWYYNEYESPSAMVEQYQEAGLNPALMYGSGSSTSSSNNSSQPIASSGGGDTQQGQSANNDAMQNLLTILGLVMQGSQVGSQVKLQSKQASAQDADTRLKNAEAAEKEYNLKTEIDADQSAPDEGGPVHTRAYYRKEAERWTSYASEFNAVKAANEATVSSINRDWLQEMYDEGVNLMRLEATGKDISNKIQEYQSDLNDYLKSHKQFQRIVDKYQAELESAQAEAAQGHWSTDWIEALPEGTSKWLKPLVGLFGSLLGKF